MTTCFECDSNLEIVREPREIQLGDRTAVVEHEFYRCVSCGEEFFTPEQMNHVQRLASAVIREEEGLLLPEAIRALRERLGLTQREFEKLLGVGQKTVARWERGTVFQNRSTDALLRVLQCIPDAVEFLAQRHGVKLPEELAPMAVREGTVFHYRLPGELALEYWRSAKFAVLKVPPGWGQNLDVKLRTPAAEQVQGSPAEMIDVPTIRRVRETIGV